MDLPRFIHLGSIDTTKYVRYRKEEDSNHALLEFSEDENAEIQYNKFEVQKSEVVEGFVHIRSCYNNKYWVRKSVDTNLIAAEANEPEEDQSKWSCTLFKPVLIDPPEGEDVVDSYPRKPQKIRLLHVDQVGENYACLSDKTPVLVLGEDQASESRTTSSDAFLAYNAEALVIFPRYVAWMAHNNNYGDVHETRQGRPTFLQFNTTNLNLPGVSHRIRQSHLPHQPFLEVQNMSFASNRGYWMAGEGAFNRHVVLEDVHMLQPAPAFFTPISLGGNHVMLMHGSSSYAACLIGAFATPNLLCLSDSATNVMAVFRVVETVRMREIHTVRYNLADSRVYEVSNGVVLSRHAIENTSSEQQTATLNVSYSLTETRSWKDAVTVQRPLANVWFCGVPHVDNGQITVLPNSVYTAAWGQEVTEARSVNYPQTVTVGPRQRFIVTVVATTAKCDVPFTYVVRETLTNGSVVTETKTDGLFKGSNYSNIETRMAIENL